MPKGVAKTKAHDAAAKKVEKSIKNKEKQAARIIDKYLNSNPKVRDMMVKDLTDDDEWRGHVTNIGDAIDLDLTPFGFAEAVADLEAPGFSYKKIKGKHGIASADLVEALCKAETNVTPDKIQQACDEIAAPRGDSGVKELSSHKKYTAELKITGASKRLYATKEKKSGTYTFVEMGNHT